VWIDIPQIAGDLSRHSPDAHGFAVSVALLIGFGKGKSPSPQAKGD
jgi:hypothetical protein